jgi:hypothetical protein
MNIDKAIKRTLKLNDTERLEALNEIAEDLANEFTYRMRKLEDAIQDALDEVSNEAKEEKGYYHIEDITQDINVKSSSDW